MTIEGHGRCRPVTGSSRLVLGAALAGLSGVGPIGYGLMFIIRNFGGSSGQDLSRGTWAGLDACVGCAHLKGRWATLLLTLIVALSVALGFTSPAQAAPGDLDTSFGGDGKVTREFFGEVDEEANAVAIQADGKIVTAGYWDGFNPPATRVFALARFNPDGSVDRSFGNNGFVFTAFSAGSAEARSVAIQRDGGIVAAGWAGREFALARFHPSGALDGSFGDGAR